MDNSEKEFLKDMFDYISLRIRGGLSSTKVGADCYRVVKNDDYKRDVCVPNYIDYTYKDIIQAYKINRLQEVGVITEREYSNLRELFNMRIALNEKLSLQMSKDLFNLSLEDYNDGKLVSKEAHDIIAKIVKIDEEFKKYHLDLDDFELRTLVDLSIQNEDYTNCDEIELQSFAKKMQKNN